jgi:hypothetical protein
MHVTLPVLVTKIRKKFEKMCDITYMYIQLYEYHIRFLLLVPLLLIVSPLLTVLGETILYENTVLSATCSILTKP